MVVLPAPAHLSSPFECGPAINRIIPVPEVFWAFLDESCDRSVVTCSCPNCRGTNPLHPRVRVQSVLFVPQVVDRTNVVLGSEVVERTNVVLGSV